MTNAKGLRLYRELSAFGEVTSYANKDVSALGIIAPFRITMRLRVFVSYTSGVSNGAWAALTFIYGGATDQLYHTLYLPTDSGEVFDSMNTYVNSTDALGTSGTSDAQAVTALTQEDWIWIEIAVDSDRNFTYKVKDDNTTTRPTTWDTTKTHGTVLNATPEQIVQDIRPFVRLSTSNAFTSRVIMEVDEIYITQD